MFVQAHIVHRQLKNKSILLAVDDCCNVFEEVSSSTHQILPFLTLLCLSLPYLWGGCRP